MSIFLFLLKECLRLKIIGEVLRILFMLQNCRVATDCNLFFSQPCYSLAYVLYILTGDGKDYISSFRFGETGCLVGRNESQCLIG